MSIPQHIIEIGQRILTQDNLGTAHPLFCVQVKRREYGYDPEYSEETVWIDPCNDYREVPEAEASDDCIETGYKDVWETVMAAFTRVGAQEYIDANGHNHRGKLRIYVESFYRCQEMIAIRQWLMDLARNQKKQTLET